MSKEKYFKAMKEYFNKVFKYDSETGNFYWKVNYTNNLINDIAGIKHKDYIRLIYGGNKIYAHQLVFLFITGKIPKEIDHINGYKSDNRMENLRSVTKSENIKNSKIRLDNKSGIIGVSWYKNYNKWNVQITNNKKRINLGYFNDFFEACCIRKSFELKYNYHENHGRK